jgi:hypothetical protein
MQLNASMNLEETNNIRLRPASRTTTRQVTKRKQVQPVHPLYALPRESDAGTLAGHKKHHVN